MIFVTSSPSFGQSEEPAPPPGGYIHNTGFVVNPRAQDVGPEMALIFRQIMFIMIFPVRDIKEAVS